jgi:hypothetical protein
MGVGQRQHVYGRVAGTDEVLTVRREDDGGVAGKTIKKWDGSQDAIAMPRTATKSGREL